MTVNRIPLKEEPIAGPDIVEKYDSYARRYMAPEYKYFVRKILHKGNQESGKVLDIGVGSGRLAVELAGVKGCDFNITGLDISRDMLKKARENARYARIEDKMEFVLASGSKLPFKDKAFDLVISYASLHHWFSPVEVFNEAYRVMKDNGFIIIRDNRRVYGNLFWKTLIRTFLLFQSKNDRDKWPRSILSSYTIPEIKSIIRETHIRQYKVGHRFCKVGCVY